MVELVANERTPKIIHFVYLSDGGEEFPLIYYIAVKSAKICNPTYDIFLHTNVAPSGIYWDCVKANLMLKKIEAPESIFGVKINRIQHKVDVLRLEILLDFGGIYLDLDTICIQPFDKFLTGKVIMGQDGDIGLCNAVIIAPPSANFIQLWYDGYREFHNDQWDEFSVKLPMNLYKARTELVQVEPPETFFLPNWFPKSLLDLFVNSENFPKAHIFHLWAYAAKDFINKISIYSIFEEDSTYNKLAREVVGKDKEVLTHKVSREGTKTLELVKAVQEVRKVFEGIYETSRWGNGSGNGSHPSATTNYRSFLEQFIAMNEISSIVDIGCGDWQSSQYVCLGGAKYIGFDIVRSIISANQSRFGSSSVSFEVMPDDARQIPSGDLLIMKDVLQHLSDAQIFFYRDVIIARFKFCLITNSWKAINYEQNGDILPGGFRSLDLKLPPYSFSGGYVTESWNEWERIRTMLISGSN